ncbi:MAG: hypothetical protein WED01_07605 [Candidatus Rokuibacteriota bacterium]
MTKSALTTSGAVVVLSAQLAEQKSVGERVEIGMPLLRRAHGAPVLARRPLMTRWTTLATNLLELRRGRMQ